MISAEEESIARKVLEPLVHRLKGLFQLQSVFDGAQSLAKIYAETIGECSFEACVAFTKSIVVDYAKPWTKNKSPVLRGLDLGFLNSRISDPTHKQLLALRHKMVAHIDEGFEGHAVGFLGVSMINDRKDPNMLAEVYVPLKIRIESTDALWWLKDQGTLERVRNHIEGCAHDTSIETSRAASSLRDFASQHAHVLSRLTDLFFLRDLKIKADGTLRMLDISEGGFSAPLPKEIQIGRANLQSTLAIREILPPGGIEVQGDGFKISVPEPEKGSTSIQVTFPPRKTSAT